MSLQRIMIASTGVIMISIAAIGIAQQKTTAIDTEALNATEEFSESLANDLLDLSVAARDKDRTMIEQYFADDLIATPIPVTPLDRPGVVAWITNRDWPTGSVGSIDRDTFLLGVENLLEHFLSIEDVRFKVKQASFDNQGKSAANISFFIVGRNPTGRREWLTATANIEAFRDSEQKVDSGQISVLPDTEPPLNENDGALEDEPWKITRFELDTVKSMVAERELFSEVALPAGLHTEFPRYGVAPNDTVSAHGVAVADVNGDGLLDIVTTGVMQNSLYLNNGEGSFNDVTQESFLALSPPATGPLFVDYDNDGDSDLFLATVGNQVLLENRLVPDGVLHFLDRSIEAGVYVPANGFSAVATDVNGDGLQDIYVASYNRYGIVMPNSWDQATNGTPNLLFLNQGDGTFLEVATEWGVRDSRWSYAAAFADIDGDGDQDLYVSNDFGENGLYLNDQGRFREAAMERGVLDPGNGMGVAFGDYDNDGDLDLHVTNMSSTAGNRILSRMYPDADPEELVLKKLAAGNSLFANDGSGHFDNVTHDVGGLPAGWAFGGGFIDFDNDGWEDIYSPNGFISGKTMEDT
ncbi:MAG TPA: VCBS repeat-containing protein [Acidobacteriota bacterium]|nr:VCBS repeat-containing protein [Acidobacteriota bacterium]